MMDKVTFKRENRERIQAVESSFGPAGRPLYQPDRVLVGEGHLMKQGQRRTEMKAFFLFNDILVYGGMILNGRWHKKQKIIPLEDLQLEDMEDSERLTNQWLIRTPSKSFFLSASSFKEKRAWIDHIEECRAKMLQGGSCQPGSTFAVSWIPDNAAYKCMRCFTKFTPTNRRHHCRQCGFVVCNSCSSRRVVISHIHPKKKLRVCRLCYKSSTEEETSHPRKSSTEEDDVASSSGEENEFETMPSNVPSCWLDSHSGRWGDICNYTPHKALLLPPGYM
ncbi:pleckstrin homology domain-containing family F member 2-like [Platichthys flesus]|uniref:pleckstrin homology domain-containing family F member 2-like n=1 Tax=Platichthys flesus TaxID=8260 RepID=UPI002DBCFFCE|nr:pleckstrin homology domain-containing family F member 2-like [Platichthys flesus]